MNTKSQEKGIQWYHKLAFIAVVISSLFLLDKIRYENRLQYARENFHVTTHLTPQYYIDNEFYDRGDVIIDFRTGLMWQKAGASEELPYKGTKIYHPFEPGTLCWL